ncbi:MAG: potassium channel family protein [Candidatus Micrarchaeota archaeon]
MDSTQEKIAYALGLNFVLIIIGSLFYKTVEGWNWVDSIYFSVGTLMTVGFGDLHATHSISRVFATIFMIIGIPVMLYTVTLIGAYSVEKRAYTKAFGVFRKTQLEHLRHGKGKARKLVDDVEKLSEQLTNKMKQLEEIEEKQEKELAKK